MQEGLGEKFLFQVMKKLEIILEMPEAFSAKHKKHYREAALDIFPFTITYKIILKKNIIFISSVHHQKKHPDKKYR